MGGINTRGTSGANKTFLNIFQNRLVLEYMNKEDLERKLNSLNLDVGMILSRKKVKGKHEGKTAYYYNLDNVEGMMTNIRVHEGKFGDFLEVELTDVEEKYSISLGDIYSRMSKDFIRRVDNLDVTKEIDFSLWSISEEDSDNGKAYSGVTIYQNEKKVEYAMTFKDLVPPIEKKRGRKVKWDFSDQDEQLFEVLENFRKENFKEDVVEEKKESKPVDNTKKDDMPF